MSGLSPRPGVPSIPPTGGTKVANIYMLDGELVIMYEDESRNPVKLVLTPTQPVKPKKPKKKRKKRHEESDDNDD